MSAPPAIDAPGAPRPPARPAALVLDLDGTCLDSGDQSLHPRVRAAVRAAAARMPVVIATGRMYRSALPWARELGTTTPLVCYQGALAQALPAPDGEGRVLFEAGLRGAVAVRGLMVARENDWHYQAYIDDQLLCERDRPEARLYARIAGVAQRYVDDLEPLVREHGSTKVVCVIIDGATEVERCMTVMAAALGSDARITRSLPQFVEIVSPLVNKAAACALVCEHLGLRLADSVAIGDAPNDIELLDAAGFAVAIETAPRNVLAVADATCAPPKHAGVAAALECLGLS